MAPRRLTKQESLLDRPARLFLRVMGGAALVAAVGANPCVLGRLFAPDGVVDYPPNLLVILLFELMLAAVGCILWRHSAGISRRLRALARWVSDEKAEPAPGRLQVEPRRAGGLREDLALEARKPIARWEWLACGAICMACLAFWVAQYHPFVLPNSDFPGFEQVSRELLRGQLPTRYERMPVFPLFMGIVGRAISVDRPELEAALILNMAFSAGVLVLLFAFARRLIGWPAIVLTALCGTGFVFHRWTLQPLVEPCLSFFVLLSLFLFHRRSRWQYAAAFVTALTRFEGALLIPVFFLLNWAEERRFWKHVLLAGLASSGFLAWMALSILHTSGSVALGSGVSPYLVQMQGKGWAMAPSFVMTVVRVSFGMVRPIKADGLRYLFWCGAVLTLLTGFWLSLRLWRRLSLALFLFLLPYMGMHVLFGVGIRRFVFPVLWIPALYGALGLTAILWLAGRRLVAFRLPGIGHVLAALALVLSGWAFYVLFSGLATADGYAPAAAYVVLAASALGAVLYCSIRQCRSVTAGLALGLTLVSLLTWPSGTSLRWHAQRSWKVYYSNYAHFLIGEWLKENLGPQERAVVISRGFVAWASGIADGRILSFSHFQAGNHEELIAELAARRASYVVYSYRKADKNNADQMYRYRLSNAALVEPFRDGADMPHFRQVAVLREPELTGVPPARVYRFLADDPGGQTGQGLEPGRTRRHRRVSITPGHP